jgi:hypothetical protein
VTAGGPTGGLGEAIKPQTSVLLGVLPAGFDAKNLQSPPGEGINREGATFLVSFVSMIQ